MGQRTWFVEDKELYFKELELWNELYKLCDESGSPTENTEDEYYDKELVIDKISKKNTANYHDVFRTSKRTEKGCYIEETITSRDECFEWIEKPENFAFVFVPNEDKISYFSDKGNGIEAKKAALKRLEEFWQEHPNGLIYFG